MGHYIHRCWGMVGTEVIAGQEGVVGSEKEKWPESGWYCDRKHSLHQACWDRNHVYYTHHSHTTHVFWMSLSDHNFIIFRNQFVCSWSEAFSLVTTRANKNDFSQDYWVGLGCKPCLCHRPKINVLISCDRSFWHCQLHSCLSAHWKHWQAYTALQNHQFVI